jgi:hypothetical protein
VRRALAVLVTVGLAFALSAEGCDGGTCTTGKKEWVQIAKNTYVCKCKLPHRSSTKWPDCQKA